MSPALELKDVTVSYTDGDSQVKALDSVNLSIDPGEFVAVVGPSGSGKSTLLAVAGALTTPDSGQVLVAGEDIVQLGDAQLAQIRRNHIGFVFQSTGNLPSALTAEEQLELASKVIGKTGRYSSTELLDKVGMKHRAKHRPGSLSGGERQRVGIARALVGDPQVLLVDEPTAALDRARSQEIVALLAKECHDFNVAGIMVTHDYEVLDHCDKVYEMVDGRLTPATASAQR
ncbi:MULTISPECIES: ABC transporter ATP-binding protein [Corynebacterium]|uniref:ABC transporter ATP-binding protein n=2 Tax=Corynebacterium TaxID=1716 RepID=A0ABU9UGP9_9CORY|nr:MULTISPECIES: ABC transporter ATP-binding protein [Corynebacterium]MBE7338796.1 ABC transporter ATP-binding protein [Corynebacterium aurimucosum]MCG7261664.1 ABC transporter ATP-binding protein [Corynebacterium aurimucosum]MCL8493615.1 ABC transporter ATP-binding protein [Corynebacterium intestinale]MCP1389847.1 ABC transporter ATP-binding protein [Corynebacterium intestinale]MTD96933.1 ABC transporter ATP-binding protein [Corynebacterium guaraldiae]